jgi:hypothetical protein
MTCIKKADERQKRGVGQHKDLYYWLIGEGEDAKHKDIVMNKAKQLADSIIIIIAVGFNGSNPRR